MHRMAIGLGLILVSAGYGAVSAASSAEVVVTAAVPGRTMVASDLISSAPAAFDESKASRFSPLKSVSISPRRANVPAGRSSVRVVAGENRAARTATSNVVVKDITRSQEAATGPEGITTVAFGRPLPNTEKAQSVEVRAITRIGRPVDRMLVAQNDAPSESVNSTEQLHEVLQEARSPGGSSGVVAVDIGARPKQTEPAPRVVRSTAPAEGVTIVGRPGEGVLEIRDGNTRTIDDTTTAINRINDEVLARMQAAREALEQRDENVEEATDELQEETAEAEAEGDRGGKKPAAAPAPEEMVRRYDWRKGIYVRVPKDAPPVPEPSIAVGPAGLVQGQGDTDDTGTVLRGRVPRGASSSSDTDQSTNQTR